MMQAILEIQDGTLSLPRKMASRLAHAQVQLIERDGHICIEGPLHSAVKDRCAVLLAIAGIWKNKKIEDPVRWQRKIRKECDRRLG